MNILVKKHIKYLFLNWKSYAINGVLLPLAFKFLVPAFSSTAFSGIVSMIMIMIGLGFCSMDFFLPKNCTMYNFPVRKKDYVNSVFVMGTVILIFGAAYSLVISLLLDRIDGHSFILNAYITGVLIGIILVGLYSTLGLLISGKAANAIGMVCMIGGINYIMFSSNMGKDSVIINTPLLILMALALIVFIGGYLITKNKYKYKVL